MDLDGFKAIFYWEWAHRLLARIIGLAFILPLLWFWRKGRLAGAVGRAVLAATCLLAMEPIVGWWMVASGLSERVEVSQYRLALHLLIATATFGALLWAAVGLRSARASAASRRFAVFSGAIAILVFCQIGFGALVAGLRAGLIYNTWPLMDGRLIPDGLFSQSPWWRNLFEDVTTVQFQHRLLAYVVVAARSVAGARRRAGGAANRAGAPRHGGWRVWRCRRRRSASPRCCSSCRSGPGCCTRPSPCCCSPWRSSIGGRRVWNNRSPCKAPPRLANLLNVALFS